MLVVSSLVLPVLAQFRSSFESRDFAHLARISNALQMYTAANDEIFPLFYQNILGGVCLPNDPTVCSRRNVWQFHIYPYLKDWKVWTAPDEQESGDPTIDAFDLSYGYNYSYLSTLCFVGGGSYEECPPT